MYSIGVITAEQSLHNIMQIDGEMQKYSNVTYLPYSSLDHLFFLYQQNAERFDALLFSGSYPYHVIMERFGSVARPCAFFSISDRDYYCLIAQLAVREPGLDFSRVYFDAPEIPVDFQVIFDRPDVPMQSAYIEPDSPYTNAYQPTLDYYQKLWDSGRVDLIVTRFSSMEKYFAQSNIRHRFLFPSPGSMLETFHGLMMRLTTEVAHDSATCVGLVLPKEGVAGPGACEELFEGMEACNKQMGNLFLIYRHGEQTEITTNVAVLRELTQQYTVCPVTAYLKSNLDFPVSVGWGCAGNVIDAHRNARRAVKEAMQNNGCVAYVVTADDFIIGPLASASRMAYTDVPDEKLSRLSRQSALSPRYISKISAVLAQRGTDLLSAEELAFSLNVTTRSASRILNKLEECGLASVQYSRQMNRRGRPAKIYKIDF